MTRLLTLVLASAFLLLASCATAKKDSACCSAASKKADSACCSAKDKGACCDSEKGHKH